jgi:hypothetical protein
VVCGKSGPESCVQIEEKKIPEIRMKRREKPWRWSSNDLLHAFNKSFYLHQKFRNSLSLNHLAHVNGIFL